jgi:membrane fusion protein (multidrug efflux system)
VTTNGTDVANAEADLANSEAAVAASEHDYASAISTLRQTEAQNAKAQSDLKRYTLLLQKQEVAQSEFDQYDSTAKAQAAAVGAQAESVASLAKAIDERRAQAAQKRATLEQTVKNAPQQVAIRNANIQARVAALKQNQAQIDQNELNLQYCHIVAPVSGIVTQRSAEIGGRIAIGQQLMMLVQTSGLWVTANFKETQLRRMRPGQRVTIHVDALDKTFEGYIQGMPAASGDRTSALPPENATGNYVKVVQRLPVRILFKKEQEGLQDLRPGMSVEPKVHFEP